MPCSILVVAHQTAASPGLVETVRRRAEADRSRFTLLVPRRPRGLHRAVDPEDHGWEEAALAIELARPLLEEAAGDEVDALIGSHDPLAAVEDAIGSGDFDEVIVSTLPVRLSRWLHIDLPRKVAALGLPVTTVTAGAEDPAGRPAEAVPR
jgi:hypothetical protein